FAFFSEDVKTMTVSNVGQVVLPDDMKPLVDRMEAVVYPTERSPVNCCMCSVNGKMTISFIRSIEQADTIRFFFRFLARNVSPDIEIYTNNWGACDEKL
ncbi:MAG: alcohol acetyltransferase, partial [Christensenella sp.]|nr:alcohol acetyltransferase [Christensenella sp.]